MFRASLTQLTPAQNSILTAIEEKISGDENDRLNVANLLTKYKPEEVFKYYLSSEPFRIFCQQSGEHVNVWAERLKSAGYTGNDIVSVDKQETCPVVNQYMSSYLLKQSISLEESDAALSAFYLNKACEFGEFNALVRRIDKTAQQIKIGTSSILEKQFFQDINRLGNLYSSVGYLHAAVVASNIATLRGAHFQEVAAKMFFSAQFSLHPSSKNSTDLLKLIAKDDSQDAALKVFGFKSWIEAADLMLVGMSRERKNLLFNEVRATLQEAQPSHRIKS